MSVSEAGGIGNQKPTQASQSKTTATDGKPQLPNVEETKLGDTLRSIDRTLPLHPHAQRRHFPGTHNASPGVSEALGTTPVTHTHAQTQKILDPLEMQTGEAARTANYTYLTAIQTPQTALLMGVGDGDESQLLLTGMAFKSIHSVDKYDMPTREKNLGSIMSEGGSQAFTCKPFNKVDTSGLPAQDLINFGYSMHFETNEKDIENNLARFKNLSPNGRGRSSGWIQGGPMQSLKKTPHEQNQYGVIHEWEDPKQNPQIFFNLEAIQKWGHENNFEFPVMVRSFIEVEPVIDVHEYIIQKKGNTLPLDVPPPLIDCTTKTTLEDLATVPTFENNTIHITLQKSDLSSDDPLGPIISTLMESKIPDGTTVYLRYDGDTRDINFNEIVSPNDIKTTLSNPNISKVPISEQARCGTYLKKQAGKTTSHDFFDMAFSLNRKK